MKDFTIQSQKDLEDAAAEFGFLPFFSNEIRGFSVEEHTPSSFWFNDQQDGPWEWKGRIAVKGKLVYGKFFRKKAGFVSLRWFADFANYRRNGYDFDSRCEEGLVSNMDQRLYELIQSHHALETRTLKTYAYQGQKDKGFDTSITRLQMQTYLNIRDFVYPLDKHGKPYGWGISEYTTPEEMFGAKKITSAYEKDPLESKERIVRHLKLKLGSEYEELIRRLIAI
ncbi:MAG: hypothetical protein LKF50_07820 [Solobacterium sp.]|jgi:hypothetical protein|nr:hypothetical protein [Solobacterium sp.]